MIETGHMALPKPKHRRHPRPAVKVFPDGREVCSWWSKAGREEYARRREEMRQRQKGCCGYCGKPISAEEATFEHCAGRGMDGGHRDDRIWDENGQPMNLAVCAPCNSEKGSKRL